MASDPIGNLVGACIKNVAAAGRAAKDVGEAAINASADYVKRKTEDLTDISRAARSGNLAGAYFETVEAFSLGESARDALGAVGLLPDDNKLLGELVSGVVNYATGNPIAAAKDAFDIFSELAKAPTTPGVPPAAGFTVPLPSKDLKQLPALPPHFPVHGNGPREPRSVLDNIVDLQRQLLEAIRKGIGAGELVPPSPSPLPPIARRAPDDMRIDLPPKLRGEIDDHPGRTGGPVSGRPISEVSYEQIFADKSLSFEDMVFMFMMKIGDELRGQMLDKMKEINELNGADAKAASGGAGARKGAGGAASGASAGGPLGGAMSSIMGGGMPDLLGAFANPENLKGLLSGAIDVAKLAAPVVLPLIGAAIGTVAPGPGNIIGGLAGGAGGMGLALGLDLLKGAVNAGAFDGVLEGAMGAFGGAAGAGGTSGASSAAPGKGGAHDGKSDAASMAGAANGDEATKRSREMLMQELQLIQSKLSEFQQALSNILNAQHQTAMNAIGNIR